MIKRKGTSKTIIEIEICKKQLKKHSWFHLKLYTDTHTNIGPPEQVAKGALKLVTELRFEKKVNKCPSKQNKRWVVDKTSKRRFQLSGDLKNAGVGVIPSGVVALVEDEEQDVPQPEEAVAEVVEEDLRRHDEDLGPDGGGAPGVSAPEVDPHLAVELLDAEVRVRLDHPPPCFAVFLVPTVEAGRRGGAEAVREGVKECRGRHLSRGTSWPPPQPRAPWLR